MIHGNFNTKIWASGKIVGEVKNGVFVKRVRASKHMLRSPRGWALDVKSLRDAEEAGARNVELEDVDNGLTYSASVDLIRAKGIQLNRGYGPQIALPLNSWTTETPGARQLALI